MMKRSTRQRLWIWLAIATIEGALLVATNLLHVEKLRGLAGGFGLVMLFLPLAELTLGRADQEIR